MPQAQASVHGASPHGVLELEKHPRRRWSSPALTCGPRVDRPTLLTGALYALPTLCRAPAPASRPGDRTASRVPTCRLTRLRVTERFSPGLRPARKGTRWTEPDTGKKMKSQRKSRSRWIGPRRGLRHITAPNAPGTVPPSPHPRPDHTSLPYRLRDWRVVLSDAGSGLKCLRASDVPRPRSETLFPDLASPG